MYFSNEEQFKELNGYTIDGVWYPRVTQIVSIKAKPALLKFYADSGFKSAKDISAKSAETGTKVHEAVEKVLVGETSHLASVDPEIKASVDSFLAFIEKKPIQVDAAHVERKVINYDKRYAGTMDALALIDGKFGILDIKTSQAIYRDYNLQTSAYMDALQRDPLFREVQTRWILRIDQLKVCQNCSATLREKGGRNNVKKPKSGKPCDGEHDWSEAQGVTEIKEFPYWEQDFEAFLGAKRLWEWENEYWLKRIGYL